MKPASGHQADHLRRVAMGIVAGENDRVLVVLGAKGGVGASAVTLAVARDLARALPVAEGVGVLAVDAHPGRDDLSVMASLGAELPQGLALTTATKLGVASKGEATASETARRLVRAARQWTVESGGWVVIDAGVGGGAWSRELATLASQTLLVSTPDRVATVNCYLTLKRLGASARSVALVANHCDEASARALQSKLARSCQQFLGVAPALAGWLPTCADSPDESPILSAASSVQKIAA